MNLTEIICVSQPFQPDYLKANNSRAVLAETKSIIYVDFGAKAFLSADIVGVND